MVGNLTRDIELRYIPNGTAVANTALASNRKYKTKMGEQAEEVCFVDVTIFGRTAEIANQYLKRGSKILIEGRLKFEQWNNQNGEKRSKHTIQVETMQMLDSKGDNTSSGSPYTPNQQNQSNNTASIQQEVKQEIPQIDIDDEIPF
ncbi:MAG: Single-stranded DNA-binding protein [uncultured Campylobacterales bacterium]|uniref:Single-stranded DNA-binding protein n=1 Tax=uncultured Campylobacterales bacterium TaxID=352960 RepID=A0A6S6SKW8_9BACT|nr:MAG: Single-stranded DNA-binding protein [uncultured Campylobacterales bacterium]